MEINLLDVLSRFVAKAKANAQTYNTLIQANNCTM